MNVTLICIAAFYVFMAVKGYRSGFVRMVTSMACSVVSLLMAQMFAPKFSAALAENPAFAGWVERNILPRVKGVTLETVSMAFAYVILFLLALAVTKLLAGLLKKIAELPVVSFVNHVAGGAFGIIEATIYVWVFMVAVTMLPQFEICGTIMKQIEASEFLFILYQNDPFFALVKSITMNFPA